MRSARFLPLQACFSRCSTIATNSHQNSHQTILASPISRGQFNLKSLFCWCREGGSNPHDRKGRRILSPKLGFLQRSARQRTDSHKLDRLKDLRANLILQDVAVNGSNVGREHAPKHAPDFGALRARSILDICKARAAKRCFGGEGGRGFESLRPDH